MSKSKLKPFWDIAQPHADIIAKKWNLSDYAANLQSVYDRNGSVEYTDPVMFKKRTYTTNSMSEIQRIVENRIQGKGGEPTIQINTPFGGGKTHTLIQILHAAREWQIKIAVVAGDHIAGDVPIWEIIERQITGQYTVMNGMTSPGKEKIERVLPKDQPTLILLDELADYITKSNGVPVGNGTLADQTNAFMQELSSYIATTSHVCLVFTLPSNAREQYGEKAKDFCSTIAALSRTVHVFASVSDGEIPNIITTRLFEKIDGDERQKVIENYIGYLLESNLMKKDEVKAYTKRFEASYPFLPEVIDVLYQRWGTFSNFQRTRGMLRLLSMTISSLIDGKIGVPFISLADFDLAHDGLVEELARHLDPAFKSVISTDITGINSGVARVDKGSKKIGVPIARRLATTIFMYSFNGSGGSSGATIDEIERVAGYPVPINTVYEFLKDLLDRKLLHLQCPHEKYYFHTIANVNKLVLDAADTLTDAQRDAVELAILKDLTKIKTMKCYLWEEHSKNIPNTPDFKLVILKNRSDKDFPSDQIATIRALVNTYGDQPRSAAGSIFFLCGSVADNINVRRIINDKLAYESVAKTETLTDSQKTEVQNGLKAAEKELINVILRKYRLIAVPVEERLDTANEGRYIDVIQLDMPKRGEKYDLVDAVYKKLKANQKILSACLPTVIRDKNLTLGDTASTKDIYTASFRLGSPFRFESVDVLKKTIADGVDQGIFGLGSIQDGSPVYDPTWKKATLEDGELIITRSVCDVQIAAAKAREEEEVYEEADLPEEIDLATIEAFEKQGKPHTPKQPKHPAPSKPKKMDGTPKQAIIDPPTTTTITKNALSIDVPDVPDGQFSTVASIQRYLKTKFNKVKLSVTMVCEDGSITQTEIEDKIDEPLTQIRAAYTKS